MVVWLKIPGNVNPATPPPVMYSSTCSSVNDQALRRDSDPSERIILVTNSRQWQQQEAVQSPEL